MTETNHFDSEAVAIIGMAGRFPGARDLDEFWRNLCEGIESIRFPSDDELKAMGVDETWLRDPRYVKASAALDGMELFDAAFFGYTPREAELMDPQHRIFLECTWEALERAGYDPARYPGAIGVFAGATTNTYLLFNLVSNPDLINSLDQVQIDVGNGADFLATRASYKLDLKGPSYTVQTACSTSLVAVHVACQSLLNEECDMALAGGIAIHVKHPQGYRYLEGGIVSPDGHCRAFDAGANGTVFGSGVGLVVLKRLADALADGDHIHAVIRGTALNNDGAVKVGYTAPSVEGQAAVISEALAVAGVRAQDIGYVETHGTGTTLGDPIEIRALTKAFRAEAGAPGRCAIGSVKTNIGHLSGAAGVASLIKTALALEHRLIPPSLNFQQPSPEIDFAHSPFYVNTRLSEWPANERGTRLAGVSSFGVGGTNAHAILEQAPKAPASGPSRPAQLLLLSAKTGPALEAATANLADYLKRCPDLNLADAAYTLQVGRQAFPHRRALVCRDVEGAWRALETRDAARVVSRVVDIHDRPVVFMFPGQGAQYVNMALELYQAESVFRQHVDRCAQLLQPDLGLDLRRLLYPDAADVEQAARQLNQTGLTQPALFVIEYALAQLWMDWGLQPAAMIGHSIGEYVAACLAGVFSLQDALALVAERGRLMQGLPSGAMLAVPLPEAELGPLLPPDLSLAAVNAPALCVVSGETQAVASFQAQLAERKIEGRRLHTSHAFHSAMMDPILEPFARRVGQVRLNPPRLPYVSNLTGDWIKPDQATDPAYWARHLRQTVRFSDGLRELMREPARVLLEVGPSTTLARLARSHLGTGAAQAAIFSSTRHPDDQRWSDEENLLAALGQLWLSGVTVDWARFSAGEQRRRVPLPTYPFERQRYWIEPGAPAYRAQALSPVIARKDNLAEWFYMPGWKSTPLPPRQSAGETPGAEAEWVLFVDELGLGEALAERLRAAGQVVLTVAAGQAFGQMGDGAYTLNPRRRDDYAALLEQLGRRPGRIVHLWSLTPETPPGPAFFDRCQELGFYSLVYLAQALGKYEAADSTQVVVVTNGLHSVVESELSYPDKATLLGVCTVIPQEYAGVSCRCLDVAAAGPDARLAELLLAEIHSASPDATLAYRGRQRWVPTFEPMPLTGEGEAVLALRPGGVYLITGGLSGVGLAQARYLAQAVQARLALVAGDDDASTAVRGLEESGAEVLVVRADVADEAQMRVAVEQALARFGRIHGVLHAAGAPGDKVFAPIQETDPTVAGEHFRPKARGLSVLERVLADLDLDFCLLNSSLSTVVGGVGYAALAAADNVMDAFARRQNKTAAFPWISVDWDAWQLEGEGEQITAISADLARLALTPMEGGQVLQRILASGAVGRVIVSTGDLAGRIEQEQRKSRARAQPQALHARPELQSDYVPPRNELERQVAAIWQQVLGIQDIGIHDNFFDLGGHSLLATQLRNQLYETFKVDLSIRAMFEHATVAGVAGLIEKQISQRVAGEDKPIAERLRLAFPTERPALLEDYLRRKIAPALNLQVEQLPPDGDLAAFDLQLAGVDLMWNLKQDFKFQVYLHEITGHPSIPGLARYLLAEMERMADLTRLATDAPLSAYTLRPYRKRAAAGPASGSAAKNRPMVFLHSSPRAGSTLFRIMLAGHPDLFCPPEINLLFFENMREWRQNIGFGHEMEWTSEGLQWAFMELQEMESEQGQAFIDRLVEQNESAQSVYARLQELAGRRLLVDKTPTYSLDLETLYRAEAMFDKPLYLYLYRHPYPVMESLLRVRLDRLFGPSLFEEPDVDPYIVAETVWALSNRNLLQFLEQVEPERCLWVRYEDLVSRPAEIMDGVCRFLGIPFHEDVLRPYDGRRGRMIGGLGDPNILQHNRIEAGLGEAWKKIKWPRRLDASTVQLAARLGYELPESAAPPAVEKPRVDELSDEQVTAMLSEMLSAEAGHE